MHKIYEFNAKKSNTDLCILLYYREFICGTMQKCITAIRAATATSGNEYLRNKQCKHSNYVPNCNSTLNM